MRRQMGTGFTTPELGGMTFPDDDTDHPLGRPAIEFVAVLTAVTTEAVAEPSQGQPVRVAETSEDSVPPNPSGAEFGTDEVTAGALPVEVGVSFPPPELI